MATYFKYAERSAESQINWAEVGKNMTDMLQEQERIRDEKISALDAATRELGEKLANPPQGEHKSANQWALEYGDNASQYMLMQEKLFKSGKMKTKDYLVSRQNLVDGTKQAFNLTKEFQETFKMKMDRYKNGESQDLELFLNAQAEKFGDFTKSQLYINPTDGSVNVAMKERRVIGGKEVFVMNQNPNDFTTISSLRNTIAGTYDKFDTNAASTAFADALGKEETASIVFGTLSKGGAITTVEDITSRTDLDADGKTIMFKFIDAENQMITAALENPYNRLSVLTNTKKFAPNGKQYTFTYDEADAKANPEKVLLKVDSATGQPTPQFNDEQMKVSNEAMRTEVRAKYDYKKGISQTAQAQLQESSEGARTARADSKAADAAAGYWNQLYTGRTAAEKKAAADTLLGTPIAQQAGLLGIDLSQNGKIKLTYADPVKNRTIDYLDASGSPVSLRDFSGLGVELHGVVDRDKAVKAGGGGSGFGKVEDLTTVTSQRQGEAPQAPKPVKIPQNIFTIKSVKSAANLKGLLPPGFTVEDAGGLTGNDVHVYAPGQSKANGDEPYIFNANLNTSEIPAAQEALQQFINMNNAGGVGAKY
jgi:hypothetical protein